MVEIRTPTNDSSYSGTAVGDIYAGVTLTGTALAKTIDLTGSVDMQDIAVQRDTIFWLDYNQPIGTYLQLIGLHDDNDIRLNANVDVWQTADPKPFVRANFIDHNQEIINSDMPSRSIRYGVASGIRPIVQLTDGNINQIVDGVSDGLDLSDLGGGGGDPFILESTISAISESVDDAGFTTLTIPNADGANTSGAYDGLLMIVENMTEGVFVGAYYVFIVDYETGGPLEPMVKTIRYLTPNPNVYQFTPAVGNTIRIYAATQGGGTTSTLSSDQSGKLDRLEVDDTGAVTVAPTRQIRKRRVTT